MAKRKVCECGYCNAGGAQYCIKCGKHFPEAPPDETLPITVLDAKALDALDGHTPRSAPLDEGGVGGVELPLFPEEEVSGESSAPCDPPTTCFIPGICSGEIKITSVLGAETDARTLLGDGESIIVGASADARVCLKGDPYVSRAHLVITRYGDEVIVKDTSTNGTYLRIEGEASVPVGSVLLVGKHLLHIGWD